ncbi:transaldolase [Ectothiorhodospiraceae bacterium WFHF3C12]|nr:transaldolase [Ectothiorhodospiraceae bacterium WFHF3C12]
MTGNASPLHTLAQLGQSVWYDNIHRQLIDSGELARMVREDGLTGVTSNPAIFEKAVTGSDDYDTVIANSLRQGIKDPEALFVALSLADIGDAADVLRPVYDRSGGRDGYVSIEVSPLLADDTRATTEEARHLFRTLGRANVMIKVPGTRAGLGAIDTLIAEGIPVNVTLLFAVGRYREVAEAYLRGLETRSAQGLPLERVASVASFFVSRVDGAVDPRLAAAAPELAGRTAIANARAAYRHFRTVFGGERFQRLAKTGAQPQRLLWASTSTKNPDYPETLYVDELIGEQTVTTLPPATFDAYRERGAPAPRLDQAAAELEDFFAALAQTGVDLDAETARLEADGVQAFVDAYRNLLSAIERKAAALNRASA